MPRRILVAEDEIGLRTLVVDSLAARGFDAAGAGDGAEALRLARAALPDVLVLDVSMPVMDAEAVLAVWVEDADLESVPVVLVSAGADLSRIAERFDVRATLAKPFDLDVLCAVVERLVAYPETPPDAPSVPQPE